MTLKEIEARLAQIRTEMDAEGADLEALNTEVDGLMAQRATLEAQAQARANLLNKIGAGEIGTVHEREDGTMPQTRYDASSPEYRSAYLKGLMDMELTEEEKRAAAFVATTTNTPAPLPTQMLNEIWDLISTSHPIIDDITMYRSGVVLEIVKHVEVAQGKAKNVDEATANDDEKNIFAKVTLAGKDYSKHVDLSYAMAKMSLPAFEAYLKKEIAAGIGEAIAKDIIAGIQSGSTMDTEYNKVLTLPELITAIGDCERCDKIKISANRGTVYRQLIGMLDATGRPVIQPSMNEKAVGAILGCEIVIEDACGSGMIYVGDPKRYVYNMVQDIMIETDRDIKKHVITHSGYARGEGVLMDEFSFTYLWTQ